MNTTKTQIAEANETDLLVDNGGSCQLVVWNDEVNSFDWVITTLIEICGHSEEQAEQCAMIIHTKGKYAVKDGTYDFLKPMCDSITERGIGATVENFPNIKSFFINIFNKIYFTFAFQNIFFSIKQIFNAIFLFQVHKIIFRMLN